ncbi:39S ribosomal protein L38, mitochondrial [Aphelenchoides besseyi]|nr:39S ribosomal protein L38, mitochondrial [Aphelenchoides besseyi]KAI6208243.1 39S ribosomal protein L38, mitochondrial [Aphelenchoides besseyi]
MKKVRSVFADLYVKGSYRAKYTPRVGRPMRPRVIAWAGPAAFYQTRWSERDKWYKARIAKPDMYPELYIINPTDYYRSLAERLEDEADKPVDLNIGFAKPQATRKKNPHSEEELERLARRNELLIDIDGLNEDTILITRHYNVFDDLFGPGAYFHNVQDVRIEFDGSNAAKLGNVIDVNRTLKQPSVKVESKSGGFTTLLMVNLDGNAYESTESLGLGHPQLVHWLVSNVPDGAEISSGNEIVSYLQPIPFHGTGFHRIAFVCFRHNEKIDAEKFMLTGSHLANRIFSTNKFLKTFEETITPSALRFCQMQWDESCDETLKSLGMKSPRFWYEWNEPLKPEQKEFPLKPMPFDRYLDMYRDPREVEQSIRRKWLEQRVHEGEVKPSKYPDFNYAENKKTLPSWIHHRLMEKNVGKGAYARLYSDFQNPAFQARTASAQ